jgi:hypothetical protein
MSTLNEYQRILNLIPKDKQQYIHYKSVYNFIFHANKSMSEWDSFDTENKIKEYLSIIEEDISNVDSYMGLELFKSYIYPMGEHLKKYGFKSITPVKYLFLYSVMIDSLLFIAFYPLFVPWVTGIVILYYFLWLKPMYKSKKVYGVFY